MKKKNEKILLGFLAAFVLAQSGRVMASNNFGGEGSGTLRDEAISSAIKTGVYSWYSMSYPFFVSQNFSKKMGRTFAKLGESLSLQEKETVKVAYTEAVEVVKQAYQNDPERSFQTSAGFQEAKAILNAKLQDKEINTSSIDSLSDAQAGALIIALNTEAGSAAGQQ